MSSTSREQSRSILSRYLISDEDEDDPKRWIRCQLGDSEDTDRLQIERSRLPASKSCDFYSDLQRLYKSPNSSASTSSTSNSTSGQAGPVLWIDDTLVPSGSSPKRSHFRLAFEIIRAKIISPKSELDHVSSAPAATPTSSHLPFMADNRYVLYTILIKRVPGLETHPAVIDRRYSDFHAFYTSLARRYKSHLAGLTLPRKQLLGNFTPEVIARRSEQFQTILVHCYSDPELRSSREFAEFLFYPELREASRLLKTIQLEEAGAIFENVYYILDKIRAFVGQCVHTLACLVGCLNAVDNQAEAARYAARAFELLDELDETGSPTGSGGEVVDVTVASELVFPLILLALRQNWLVGDRRARIETRRDHFCAARSLAKSSNSHPTLLECLLKKDFQPLLS